MVSPVSDTIERLGALESERTPNRRMSNGPVSQSVALHDKSASPWTGATAASVASPTYRGKPKLKPKELCYRAATTVFRLRAL